MTMMMMMIAAGWLLLLSTSAHAMLRGQWSKSITCRVMYIDVFEIDVDDRLECEVISGGAVGHSFTIDLPTTLVEEHRDVMMKGQWYIEIQGAQIEETEVDGYGMIGSQLTIPDPEKIKTVPPPTNSTTGSGRALATGRRSLMVARVTVSDSRPTYTANQLRPWYFDSNSFSVTRQYNLCSSGQQIFTAWSTSVLDVFVSGSASSFTQTSLVNAAITEVQIALGNTNIPVQHVAFILPPGVPSFVATGQVGGWRTTFYDTFGGIPNTIMHELGHNLGLGHAGIPGDQYGDVTSIMGYGELSQFAPSKCFNACDHINFGWFTDRTRVVDPANGQQTVTLASFVDYSSTSSNQPVVLKIGDYCLSYNKAKGVNFQTQASYNQVSVAIAGSGSISTRLRELDETTAPYTEANYNGGSQELVIRVCRRAMAGSVDYATVAIGLGSASCGVVTSTFRPPPPPPPPPTPPPVVDTPSPSMSTDFPTFATSNPTVSPFAPPTPPPTRRSPTPRPVVPPTPRPVVPPTPKPFTPPTVPPGSGPFGVMINSGSSSAYTDGNGAIWSADTFFIGGATYQQRGATIFNTPDPALYQTQRIGQIQYSIPVPKVNNYQVIMTFAEIDPNAQARGARVFDIYFQGALAYNNFDIFSAAGGGYRPVSLTPVIAVVGGTLKISFVSEVNLPLVAGIEVLPY